MFKLVDRRKGYLFASSDLRQIIETALSRMHLEVEGLEADRFLNTAPADLASYLVEKSTITAPVLLREQWTVSEAETKVDVRYDSRRWIDDRSRPVLVPGQRIEIEVPVEGSIDLLYARASTFSSSPPRAEIRGNAVVLVFEIPHDSGDRDIKQQAERTLNEIEQHLTWIRNDLAGYNSSLPGAADAAISGRRERLLANRGRVAALGIPLKRRENAPATYAPPEVRRKVLSSPPPASSAPFAPEPAMDGPTYEHILNVIQNMAHVMERSPSAFRNMAEEDIRQHFLVQLNGQFEGSATGETFNVSGKTDILLRVNGRNVFIGECKFWKGPKQFGETIGQLLSYTAWRDTKTAILVFNRDTSLSTVLGGVDAEVKKHEQFKRIVQWSHESGFRYVLHQTNDSNRELVLTVLVFDVPKPE
ncbi:MAG: hypothetical protein ACREMD_14140 [Gemmatimonadota bacterium]